MHTLDKEELKEFIQDYVEAYAHFEAAKAFPGYIDREEAEADLRSVKNRLMSYIEGIRENKQHTN